MPSLVAEIGDAIERAGFEKTSKEVAAIVEAIGGLRQAKVTTPLLFNTDTLEDIRSTADDASGSLARDGLLAQEGLGVKLAKLRKEFFALFVQLHHRAGRDRLGNGCCSKSAIGLGGNRVFQIGKAEAF